MKKPMEAGAAVILVLLSGIACYLIGVSSPYNNDQSMGSLIYPVIAFFSTVFTLFLLLVTRKEKQHRNRIVLVLCLLNLLVGVYLYFLR